jgi:hypothetical protein
MDPKKIQAFGGAKSGKKTGKPAKIPPAMLFKKMQHQDDEDDEDEKNEKSDNNSDNPPHGEAGHDHEDGDEQVAKAAAQVAAGKLDKDVARQMEGYDPAEDGNPPAWVADEDIWEKAKEAVDPEGDGADKYDEPYAVVAQVYFNMGGTKK